MLAIMVDNLNIGKLPKKETAADNNPLSLEIYQNVWKPFPGKVFTKLLDPQKRSRIVYNSIII